MYIRYHYATVYLCIITENQQNSRCCNPVGTQTSLQDVFKRSGAFNTFSRRLLNVLQCVVKLQGSPEAILSTRLGDVFNLWEICHDFKTTLRRLQEGTFWQRGQMMQWKRFKVEQIKPSTCFLPKFKSPIMKTCSKRFEIVFFMCQK